MEGWWKLYIHICVYIFIDMLYKVVLKNVKKNRTLITSCSTHYRVSKTFLRLSSDFDVGAGGLVGWRTVRRRFIVQYITYSWFHCKVHADIVSFLFRQNNETQVLIRCFVWSVVSWCVIQRFKFLVKHKASNLLQTFIYLMKFEGFD